MWVMCYTVLYFHEDDDGVSQQYEDFGFVCGKNFAEAASQLEEYYGAELVAIKNLEYVTQGPLVVPDEQTANTLKNMQV